MPRIPVTEANLRAFLAREMTADNYQLFYGLHTLSDDRFAAIVDALLNGDCQPEELVRLGGFSPQEADDFILSVLGDWTKPGVAAPNVGTDGYAYLTQTLGLETVLQAIVTAAVTVPGPDAARFLGVRLLAGAPGDSYASPGAISTLFASNVLPAALAPNPYGYYFPSGAGDVVSYIIEPGDDAQLQGYVQAWYMSVFGSLEGAPSGSLAQVLFSVNDDTTVPLRANPGLAQWLLSEPETPPLFHLLLLREAAVRTAAGAAYSKADAVAAVTSLEGTLPGPVATSRVMAGIYFWSSTLSAAATNALVGAPGDADWLALQARAVRVAAAYSRLSGYRLRLRGFLLAAYNGALSTIQGDYPAG